MNLKYLDIGSNIIEFANNPITCPVSYKLPDGKLHLFTIEDSNQGLVLTTELRDANKDIIAKINKNKIEKLNGDYKTEGTINNGGDFKVIRTKDNAVIFNLRTIDEYIKITGIFNFTGWEIEVTNDKVYINPGNYKVWGNHMTTVENRCITLSNYGISL